MNYEEAIQALKEGKKVRLPEWRGYWMIDESGSIVALTKDGDFFEPWLDKFKDRTDWEIANGLDFGWAITALKAGKLVTREGWNGKGMFVFRQVPATIGTDIIPRMQSLPDSCKAVFANRGESINYSNQLALVKADNSINGWAPSTADALAEDWQLFEPEFIFPDDLDKLKDQKSKVFSRPECVFKYCAQKPGVCSDQCINTVVFGSNNP